MYCQETEEIKRLLTQDLTISEDERRYKDESESEKKIKWIT